MTCRGFILIVATENAITTAVIAETVTAFLFTAIPKKE